MWTNGLHMLHYISPFDRKTYGKMACVSSSIVIFLHHPVQVKRCNLYWSHHVCGTYYSQVNSVDFKIPVEAYLWASAPCATAIHQGSISGSGSSLAGSVAAAILVPPTWCPGLVPPLSPLSYATGYQARAPSLGSTVCVKGPSGIIQLRESVLQP